MKLKNLRRNILYQIHRKAPHANSCAPMSTDFLYEIYSDIPAKHITSAIASMRDCGWIKTNADLTRVQLTGQGRSKARVLTFMNSLLSMEAALRRILKLP